MKKILSLVMACSIAISSFSAPGAGELERCKVAAWDIPLQIKKNFSDPVADTWGAFIVGCNVCPTYKLNLQFAFNQSVPVPYYAVLGLWGTWADGSSYKTFTINFNTGQWFKSVDYPLGINEDPATATLDLLDYGPQ